MVPVVGLEPTTPALSRRCSDQLSYTGVELEEGTGLEPASRRVTSCTRASNAGPYRSANLPYRAPGPSVMVGRAVCSTRAVDFTRRYSGRCSIECQPSSRMAVPAAILRVAVLGSLPKVVGTARFELATP